MDDNTFWHKWIRVIVTGIIFIVFFAFALDAYSHYLTYKEIKAGVDPLDASCAHNTQASRYSCPDALTKQTKGENKQ